MSITTAPKSTVKPSAPGLNQGVAYATAASAEASEKAVAAAKNFVALNQASLRAIAEAGQILTAGSQDLIRQMAASSQSAFAEAMSGFQALARARTLQETLALQASLVRTSAAWAMSEGSRFAQASKDLIEKASAPLTASAAIAAERFAALRS
jgi:hypothetical protein